MFELLFFFVSLLIYLASYLYWRLAILLVFMLVLISLKLEINIVFVLVILPFLTIRRFNKNGIKDEL